VSLSVRIATQGLPAHVHTVIAGLGGRPITKTSLRGVLTEDDLPLVTFLDLDRELVQRELDRTRAKRRSGPHAENMLRDLGSVASGPVG
jgi:pyruvate ferredoxin oxidoreductase alpha subunit